MDSRERLRYQSDTPRQGDLDGRGNLALAALSDFSIWFLKVCLDQIRFMSQLFDNDGLTGRLRAYPGASGIRPEAATLLIEIFRRGEIARGDTPVITGLGERTARKLLGDLVADGIISSASEKARCT